MITILEKIDTCTISKCKNKIYCKKICSIHYDRYKKSFELEPKKNQNKTCSVNECINKPKNMEMCKYHYTRFNRYGNPLIEKYNKEHDGKCSEKNCNNDYFGKGFCKSHYNFKIYLKKQLSTSNLTVFQLQYKLHKWSKQIKIKYKNICQQCNSKENVITHHIIYRSFYPKLMFVENNSIVLCIKCHLEIHSHDR